MDGLQKLVVVLLIVAIVFSVISIVLTLSLTGLKPINFSKNTHAQESVGASIGLFVEPKSREANGT